MGHDRRFGVPLPGSWRTGAATLLAPALFAGPGPLAAWGPPPVLPPAAPAAAPAQLLVRLHLPWVGRLAQAEASWRHFRPPQVRGLAFDEARGALWAATPNGALRWASPADPSRHDRFTTVDGLLDDDLSAVAVDGAGRVWLGGIGGVSRRDPDGRWTRWAAADGLPVEAGASRPEVLSLALGPAGQMLAGTKEGLVALGADGRWARFANDPLAGAWVRDIAASASLGEIIIATMSGAGRRSADGTWQRYGTDGVYAAAYDVAGNAWFGGRGVSVRRANDGGWDYYELPTYLVWDLAMVPDGSVWAGTDEGLSRRDPAGNWEHQLPPGGDRSTRLMALALAGDGRLWAGGWDGHLYGRDLAGRWNARRLDGVPEGASAIAFDGGGRAWIGGDSGVARRSPDGSWAWFGQQAGLSGTSVRSLVVDRAGQVWVATGGNDGMAPYGGLYTIDAAGRVVDRTPPGLEDHIGLPALLGPDGSVWHAVTLDGLLVHRPDGRRERVALPAPEAEAYLEWGAATADGRLWWASDDTLLGLGPGGDWRVLRVGPELPVGTILDLGPHPSGELWVLGKLGIARVPPGGEPRFSSLGALGFPREQLWSGTLGIAADGSVAVGYYEGLSQMAVDGSWLHHGAATPKFLANVHAIRDDPAGDLWFLGSEVSVLQR